MGAENSNLRSIESLNSSLSEIEKRMYYLEGVKFHHERTGAVDDAVLVAGKLIRGNPRVSLVLGPVLGFISCDSVRVLVETEQVEDLTLNIFEVQHLQFDTPLFMFSQPLKTNAGIPTSALLKNLTANNFYYIYIGGIDSSQVLSNYAMFRTLPNNPNWVRTLYINDSRVDVNNLSETSLWRDIAARCFDTITLNNQSDKSGPAHLLIHTGNFLSVDNILQQKYTQIIDQLVTNNCSESFIQSSLVEVENELKQLYRKAFTCESVRSIVKRCGCVFLSGDGESGRLFSASFNKDEAFGSFAPQHELKMQLLGIFVRLARRISWSYMRQLWDDDYTALATDDAEREYYHRSILMTRMAIQNKKRMLSTVEECLVKTKKEFGVEYKAYIEISDSCESLRKDLKSLDQILRNYSVKSSEYNTNNSLFPNGVCACLGPVNVVLIEACWGLIGEDGSVSVEVTNAVNIHEKILEGLHKVLNNPVLTNMRQSIIFATSTTLIPLETLEMRQYNLNKSQYLLNANEISPFTFVDLDVKKVLEWLTAWQKQSINYSVLLVEATNQQYSSKGLLSLLDPDDIVEGSTSTDTVRFAAESSTSSSLSQLGLQFIRVGCLELHTSIAWRDFDRFFMNYESESQNSFSKALNSIEYHGDSFWDVVLLPTIAITVDSTASVESTLDSTKQLQLECVLRKTHDNNMNTQICFGPCIGLVSPSSAEITVEFTTSGDQKLLCFDQFTGDEHMAIRFVKAGQPMCFVFDQLEPNTAYEILIAQCSSLPISIGCFTTAKNVKISEVVSVPDAGDTLSILKEGMSSKSPVPIVVPPVTAVYESLNVLLMGSQHVLNYYNHKDDTASEMVQPPQSQPPTATTSRTATPGLLSRASSAAYMSRPGTALTAGTSGTVATFQGTTMGITSRATTPGARELTPPAPTERTTARHVARDILSQSWNGIDLTVSFSTNINWVNVVEPVMLLLNKAESNAISEYSANNFSGFGVNMHLIEAEQYLRDIYRLNWNKYSELGHSTGSHLVIASPLVEFLSVLNAMFATSKGISAYAYEHLTHILIRLHNEYGCMYDRGLNGNCNGKRFHTAHFLADNSVCIYEIQPVIGLSDVVKGDGFEYQLYYLSKVLSTFGEAKTGNNSRVYTLTITAASPLVTQDMQNAEQSFRSSESTHEFSFTVSQTLQILDLIASWVEVSPESRKCLLLCGGASAGFSTNIEIHPLSATSGINASHSRSGSNLNTSRSGKLSKQMSRVFKGIAITQICCGFSCSPFDILQVQNDGLMNSTSRKYVFVHTKHNMGCGVVEIPLVLQKKSSVYSLQRIELYCDMLFSTQIFKRPRFVSCPFSEQFTECLPFLYMPTIPSGGCSHDYVPDNIFSFLTQIKGFISAVVTREIEVFKKCYVEFISRNTILTAGRCDVEECFIKLNHWVISRLQLRNRKICKQPSRFVIRIVWDYVVSMYTASLLASKIDSKGVAPETAVENSAVMSEIAAVASVTTSMHMFSVLLQTDCALFIRFMQMTIETQLFVEYLSVALAIQNE